jgi:hypothetical protein
MATKSCETRNSCALCDSICLTGHILTCTTQRSHSLIETWAQHGVISLCRSLFFTFFIPSFNRRSLCFRFFIPSFNRRSLCFKFFIPSFNRRSLCFRFFIPSFNRRQNTCFHHLATPTACTTRCNSVSIAFVLLCSPTTQSIRHSFPFLTADKTRAYVIWPLQPHAQHGVTHSVSIALFEVLQPQNSVRSFPHSTADNTHASTIWPTPTQAQHGVTQCRSPRTRPGLLSTRARWVTTEGSWGCSTDGQSHHSHGLARRIDCECLQPSRSRWYFVTT